MTIMVLMGVVFLEYIHRHHNFIFFHIMSENVICFTDNFGKLNRAILKILLCYISCCASYNKASVYIDFLVCINWIQNIKYITRYPKQLVTKTLWLYHVLHWCKIYDIACISYSPCEFAAFQRRSVYMIFMWIRRIEKKILYTSRYH